MVFFATVAVILLGTLTCGLILRSGDTIFPNVCAAGIELGGMTTAEAAQTLRENVGSAYSQELRVLLPDQTIKLDPARTEISLDADRAAELARQYGRDGGPLTTLFAWFESHSGTHEVDIRSTLKFNDDYLRSEVNSVVVAATEPMTQSAAVYAGNPDRLMISIGKQGKTIDSGSLYNTIVDAYSRADFSDITVKYITTMYDPMPLTSFYQQYCTPSANAYYDTEKKRIVPEVVGYGFDLTAVQQQVDTAPDGSQIEIPFRTLEPEVTAEALMAQYFSDVLGSCDAPHTVNPPRTENLRLACKAINGTILNPGDVFSFNEVVGERTKAKGYQDAIIFAEGGDSEDGTGGGVCQVASAIYYSALHADLKIVERTEHMYVVDYVPMGMDATVYWGSVDFKFSNSTEHPIAITAEVSNGAVHIRLLGTKTENTKNVKMTYDVLKSEPFEIKEELDLSKEVGFEEVRQTGYTGYLVRTYKHYLDKDGNELSSEQEANSLYKRRDKIITKGPTAAQAAAFAAGQTIPDVPEGVTLILPENAPVTVLPEQPTTETPTTDTPTADTPAAETPTTETPTADTPTTDTPTAETPTAETPTTETPTAEIPTTDTPTPETPAAETPATPETPTAETPAPETPAAETPAAETPAPETPAEP